MFHLPDKRTQMLSPKQYLGLTERDLAGIERIEIVPPKLGGGFGGVRVTYRFPRVHHSLSVRSHGGSNRN